MITGPQWIQMWLVDSLATLAQVAKEQSSNLCVVTVLFFHTDSTPYSNAHFGQNSDIIIALDNVACTVYESRLIDCPYDSDVSDCTHSHDAGVRCVARELHGHKYLEYTNQITAVLPILQNVLMAASD